MLIRFLVTWLVLTVQFSKLYYLVRLFVGVVRWALPTRPVSRFPRARCLTLGNSLVLCVGCSLKALACFCLLVGTRA